PDRALCGAGRAGPADAGDAVPALPARSGADGQRLARCGARRLAGRRRQAVHAQPCAARRGAVPAGARTAGEPRCDAGAAVHRRLRAQRAVSDAEAGAAAAAAVAQRAAAARLAAGAAQSGITMTPAQGVQLLRLVHELLRWNKAYSLAAITDPAEIPTHHLLDSLAAQPDLQGARV